MHEACLSAGVKSQPSNVFMVVELAIRITAFVSDPTQVIMNAESVATSCPVRITKRAANLTGR